MKIDLKNKWTPVIVAVAAAFIVLIYYVSSGRSSYDLQMRQLTKSSDIKSVDASDSQKVTVKCKSGENYQIDFSEGQATYEGLIFTACGNEGGVVEDGTATEEVAVSQETASADEVSSLDAQ